MNPSEYYQEQYWDHERPGRPASNTHYNRAQRELIHFLKRHTEGSEYILDVGCGDGQIYAREIKDSAKSYVGVDISVTALQRARKSGIDVVQYDTADRLPFSEHTFDAAICIDVLEHLFDPEGLVIEIQRTLRQGGTLVATVPNIAHFPHRLRLLGGKFVAGGLANTADTPWRDPHIRFFTLKALKSMIDGAGFRKVDIIGNNTAFLVRFPILSVVLRNIVGRDRVLNISDRFEPVGKIWPTLFAGRLIAVAWK